MALPSSGTITAAMINVELGRASNAPFNLNDSAVRALAGKPSGAISFSDFWGKSSYFCPKLLASSTLNLYSDPWGGFTMFIGFVDQYYPNYIRVWQSEVPEEIGSIRIYEGNTPPTSADAFEFQFRAGTNCRNVQRGSDVLRFDTWYTATTGIDEILANGNNSHDDIYLYMDIRERRNTSNFRTVTFWYQPYNKAVLI